MTQDERDQIARDTLFALQNIENMLTRLDAVFQYPLSVHETGQPTRYY